MSFAHTIHTQAKNLFVTKQLINLVFFNLINQIKNSILICIYYKFNLQNMEQKFSYIMVFQINQVKNMEQINLTKNNQNEIFIMVKIFILDYYIQKKKTIYLFVINIYKQNMKQIFFIDT